MEKIHKRTEICQSDEFVCLFVFAFVYLFCLSSRLPIPVILAGEVPAPSESVR